ncbi:MAG: mismatch repair protein MutS2 [Thermotogota bacterium]|nr:mismatch repair protein MutS2 [Thermotogota bacterium]HCZ06665.1 endonuclease MutS2 [Thermotogota bacterium]
MNDLLSKLEFHEVVKQVSSYASSPYGKRHLEKKKIPEDLNVELELLTETLNAFLYDGGFSFRGLEDIDPLLSKSSGGGILEGKELRLVATAIEVVEEVVETIRALRKYPELARVVSVISIPSHVVQEVKRCIDADGYVKDSASELLKQVRKELKLLEREIQSRLSRYLGGKTGQALQEFRVYQRGDRYVLPVRSDRRSMIHGIVVGSSSSGATLFLEPEDLIPLNDELVRKLSIEREEVTRILRQLTDLVLRNSEALMKMLDTAGWLDSLAARARYAISRKASVIKPSEERVLDLKKARHPLIPDEKVVPIDLSVGGDYNVLVITGPNTGGKTVALKTAGLASLMMKMGYPVLCDPSSKIPLFENIFADIGDEQNIAENLSTFTAHMRNVLTALKQAGSSDLVLLDELGTGTDPKEGGALGIAILEELSKRGSLSLITTHLAEIKFHALKHPKMEVASVEFDVQRMAPTYRIRMGVPDGAHAIETAKVLGFPSAILERAESLIDPSTRDLWETVRELQKRLASVEELHAELKQREKEISERLQELETMKEELKREGIKRVDRELTEMINEIESFRRKLHSMIMESSRASLEEQKKLVNELSNMEKKLSENRKDVEELKLSQSDSFHKGDYVRFKDGTAVGQVVELEGKKAIVQFDSRRITVPVYELVKAPSPQHKTVVFSGIKTPARSSIRTRLDVRGKTVEEAWQEVDNFIDELVLAGVNRAEIVHGKGTGRLAKGIWEHLRKDPRVKDFRLGTPQEGGTGVTVVEL